MWVIFVVLSRFFKFECKIKVCKEFYMYIVFEILILKDLIWLVFLNDKMNLKDILYVYFFWLKVINMKLEFIEKLERILCKKYVMMLYDWKIFI